MVLDLQTVQWLNSGEVREETEAFRENICGLFVKKVEHVVQLEAQLTSPNSDTQSD